MNFKGRVAIVTGASSGIGASTAKLLAKLGAKVSLIGRNVANLLLVSKECERSSPAFVIPADLTKEAEIKKVVMNTVTQFGQLDLLVNNAGILEAGSIETTSLDQFDHMMTTNMRSVYYMTMLAAPHLARVQGNIVNVSSINGLRAFPGTVAYNVSKAALDHFTRCVALELAPKGVRVNAVNPGVIVTNLLKRGSMSEDTLKAFMERAKQTHALGRPGQPDEVAATIAFLASDLASNITGVNMPVDGGRHAMCSK